jgi:hypothetical protein
MFETDIKNLASVIVAEALNEATPFQDKVDAFKAVTTYYGLLLKNRDSAAAEQAPVGPSFLDFSAAVEERANGGATTKVRAGGRKRGADTVDAG